MGDITIGKSSEGFGRQLLFLLLVILLLFAAFAAYVQSQGVSVTTASQEAQGQCDFTQNIFNTQAEAFTLAQQLEAYRSANPTFRNYGMGSYTICYKDGTQQRFPSPIAPGYTQPSLPPNATHSEQAVYQWLLKQFSSLSLDFSTVTGIYAVIFSQVVVCELCRPDMVSWLRNLRQAGKTNRIFLSIWDIARGKGFVPTVQPSGNGIPLTIGDIERVPIVFEP